MILNIINKTKRVFDKDSLSEIVEMVVEESEFKIKKNSEINLFFISSKEIKNINKKYRNKNKPTDVLTFRYEDGKKFIAPPNDISRAGDVFIAPDVVKENSLKYENNFKEEMKRVLIHGILHLTGYDHEGESKEAEKMKSIEVKLSRLITYN